MLDTGKTERLAGMPVACPASGRRTVGVVGPPTAPKEAAGGVASPQRSDLTERGMISAGPT
ncbi:hypothetical protein GCM10009528_07040 [Kineococcus aurantiacus]